MSNTALQGTDGGMVGGTTAAGASPEMPLDPDNQNPVRGPELVATAGRMNTVDMHMLAHKFRLDLIKWTPTQLPGTILGNWKNHPSIHPFTRLIANHYLYWAGSFKLTFTICGSGLVGGRLRFIRVPPHITDEQIRNYSVNDLSYYDGFDLDPKSLLTISIPFEDINRQKMHVMSDDLSIADAFGSRILVIVYGQLQAQIGDNNGLSVIVEVEMMQDFVISTFVPKMLNTPTMSFDWLSFGGKNETLTYGDRKVYQIMVREGTMRVAKQGFNLCRRSGGEYWYKNSSFDPALRTSFTRYIESSFFPATGSRKSYVVDDNWTRDWNGGSLGVPGQWKFCYAEAGNAASVKTLGYSTDGENGPKENEVTVYKFSEEPAPLWLYYSASYEDEGLEFAPLNNERIIAFGISYHNPDGIQPATSKKYVYPALQCTQLGMRLGQNGKMDPQTSHILAVSDSESGAVVMYAKLYPEGIMTTNAGTDAMTLPTTLRFTYLSTGLRTDQIPTNTPVMRADLRALAKETRRSKLTIKNCEPESEQ